MRALRAAALVASMICARSLTGAVSVGSVCADRDAAAKTAAAAGPVILPTDRLETAHVRAKRLRDRDRSVLLLIILEDCNQGSTDGEPRSVERVDELHFRAAARAELDVGAPRLKRFAVAAGRNLAIRLLARQPDFDVVGLRGRESHVA